MGMKCDCLDVLESYVIRLADHDFGHGHGLKPDRFIASSSLQKSAY